jgi:hypothetical protein
MYYYEGTECGGLPWELTGSNRLESGNCDLISFDQLGTPGAESAEAYVTDPNRTGSCTTNVEPLATVTWDTNAQGCGVQTSSAGCDTGVCLPNPPEALEGLCVSRTGDQTCPAGFPNKQVFYADVIDNRTCACSCDVTCPTSIEGFTSDECTTEVNGPMVEIPTDGTCVEIPADPSVEGAGVDATETRSFDTPDATCPATVNTSGGVTQTNSTTVCCE